MGIITYTWSEWLWQFFACAFFGWVIETAAAALQQKRFVNRGLVNSPLCTIYGVSAVMILLFFQELHGFWLFCAAGVLTTVLEWIAGHSLERMFHEKWWHYSGGWNLDGYISLRTSLLWGLLGVIYMRWGQGLLARVFSLLPRTLGIVLIWILSVLFLLDIFASLAVVSGKSRKIERWAALDYWFTGVSVRLEMWLNGHIERRILRAYPLIRRQREAADVLAEAIEKAKESAKEAAEERCSFYELVWLFVIGSFLGDITETLFCRLKAGVWMSRSSVVWGPFSIVWGFGIAALTALLYRYRDRPDSFLFAMGTVLGGVYEYLCSVLSEIAFGTVFWDYSEIPFNLGGRINLLYCFFWGIATVVWFKLLYPPIARWIWKIPLRPGVWAARALAVFMCCNMAVSGLALMRQQERLIGVEASHIWEELLDDWYDDETLQRIYPGAIRVES